MTSYHNKSHSMHHFNSAANDYLAHADLQSLTAKYLLNQFNPIQQTILDIGSGPGLCSAHINLESNHYHPLDLSKNMLTTHKSICADMDRLPIKPGSLDSIIANLSFHWSHNLEQLFNSSYHSLKPGGQLLASICTENTFHELRKAWQALDTFQHTHEFPSLNEIERNLSLLKLKKLSIEQKNYTFHKESLLKFFRHLKKLGVNNAHPNQAKGLTTRKKILQVEQNYRHLFQGSLPVTYEVAYVSFTKA